MSKWKSALYYNGLGFRVSDFEVYLMFTIEPLHSLQLGISKMQKACVVSYLSLEGAPKIEKGRAIERNALGHVKETVLPRTTRILLAVEKESESAGQVLKFSRKRCHFTFPDCLESWVRP